MSPVFGNDPWWIVLIKVVGVFVLLLTWTIFNVWFERRVLGKMQNRKGPIMNGPFGLGQAMGDGVKLLLKEDFRPARTDALVFNLAPMLTAVAAFSSWAVIPFGGEVRMFGVETRLQVTDLPVAALLVLAIAGVGFYGFVLAGWASSGTYSLLGSMRATAQVISYEVAMGLSLVAVFMVAGSMSTSQIVEAQHEPLVLFGATIPLPGWYVLPLLPSFIIYFISMFGETNQQPFDMPSAGPNWCRAHHRLLRLPVRIVLPPSTSTWPPSRRWRPLFWAATAPAERDSYHPGWWGLLWFLLKVQFCCSSSLGARLGAAGPLRPADGPRLGCSSVNLLWIVMLRSSRLRPARLVELTVLHRHGCRADPDRAGCDLVQWPPRTGGGRGRLPGRTRRVRCLRRWLPRATDAGSDAHLHGVQVNRR